MGEWGMNNKYVVYLVLSVFLVSMVSALPDVDFVTPSDGDVYPQENVPFTCYVIDDGIKDLSNITYFIWNSLGQIVDSNVSTLDPTGIQSPTWNSTLPYGMNYNWNCLAKDVDGSFAWASSGINRSFDVDIPFETGLVSPTNFATVTTRNFTLNYTVNRDSKCTAYSDLDSNSLKPLIGGINVSVSAGDNYFPITDMIRGTYHWNVYCYDPLDKTDNDWMVAENTPIEFSIIVPCPVFTNMDDCDDTNICEWEFNASNGNTYECRDDMIADYCNLHMMDFEACINETNLFGCYWDMDFMGTDCMPVDGNCSQRTVETCMDYVGCALNSAGDECFSQNQLIASCTDIEDDSTCDTQDDCAWEIEMEEPMCILNCWQYDAEEGGNESECFEAFGGGVCKYDPMMGECDPFGFDEGGDDECFICHQDCLENSTCHGECDQYSCMGEGMTFSDCFNHDGDDTACKDDNDCVWMPVNYCEDWDGCFSEGNGNHGFCNPDGMTFSSETNCWQYDGDRSSCDNAINFGDPCLWSADPWAPLVAGTENGFCNPMMGGAQGCWDAFNEESCVASANMGMPCEWMTSNANGWCEEKGCWNYWDSGSCAAAADEGCKWNSDFTYCYEEFCSDQGTEADCNTAIGNGLDCTWNAASGIGTGWCEDNGCWQRDWTNQTYCEAKTGCKWDNNICNEDGCWNYEIDSNDCEVTSGLDCSWKTGSNSWCEEKRCWSYDGNQTGCEAASSEGLDCTWSGSSCLENFKECDEIINMKECFDTGWCFWDGSVCAEPNFGPMEFFNPGCWAFDQAGQATCENVTACNWGGSNCVDSGSLDEKGVQCNDINDSQLCNGIPMLSTCCSWNGTMCNDAPQTTACWDNMQEPPEGAYFCDDYNAKNSKSICEQIAGDPWYMPCLWDTTKEECRFESDTFFGGDATGFEFNDLNEGTCANAGGEWISEQWTDPTGAIYFDEWCEMNFGFGSESCEDSCWACEQQNNGSSWSTVDDARGACEESASGCNFWADSYAFNGLGWCDMNWQKQGNCDQNCWDCWETDMCQDSNAECKWFVDPWNDNMGWCDDKNIKTCDDDCFMCWDSNNCGDSDADCTWNTDNWFCEPKSSGTGGESYEVCFDGIDNDADTFVDCGDPECMFDNFCGGSGVFDSNCPSIPTNDTCIAEGCAWVTDMWDNSWCDMNGSQCWMFDDDETACDNAGGCNYETMDNFGNSDNFCDINFTLMDTAQCWNYGESETTCTEAPSNECVWIEDPWCDSPEGQNDPWCQGDNTGWCDHELWSCKEYDQNEAGCDADPSCGWITDWFNPDWGWCDPVCFSLNDSACGTNPTCQLLDSTEMGWCEPENMFKGCWDYGIENDCNNDGSCAWFDDPFTGGFCGDLFMHNMVGDMDPSPPLMLANDDCTNTNPESDICGLGIKDDPGAFGIGTNVYNMADSALCDKTFTGDAMFTGSEAAKFYWYFDTNGNQTGGCNATDDSSLFGFDLKFKYETSLQDGELVETKVAYKCLSGQWSPSMIKLTPWVDKSCYMVNGGVISISKEDLSKLSVLDLFDETADMRIYATTAISSGNDVDVLDTIGPVWYSPGAADFKFEDCSGFVDTDGDGLTPSEDPDCGDFLKYGYIDMEQGSKCGDEIDNDGNFLTDCEDPGCMYDPFYCEVGDYANDITAPKITWLEIEEFMNGAFVGVDTNKPTNATLEFFKNDSYCSNSTITVLDPKQLNDYDLDDYSVWHDFPVDQIYFDEMGYDHTFVLNETYYFKLQLCDKKGNCALSACNDLTVTEQEDEFFVGFKLPSPGVVTDPLGKLEVDFGDAGVINDNTGLKLNDSSGRYINLTFSNPNATDAWSITFIGVDLFKAQSMNISDTFIVNTSGGALVGMDSDKWVELAQKLGVDLIKIVIPEGIAAGTTGSLMHCPDDAVSLSDPDCIELDLDEIDCIFTTTSTTCFIPTSIGFSVFGILEVEEGGNDDESDGGGSSGGGGSSSSSGGLGSLGSEVKAFDNSMPGEILFELTKKGVGIDSLKFNLNKNKTYFALNIKKISRVPSTVPDPLESITRATQVINFFDFKKTSLLDDDHDGIEIEFSINKTWFESNFVDEDQIKMLRFVDDKWVELDTTLIRSVGESYGFTAKTPGFSYFATVVMEKEESEIIVEEPELPSSPITGNVISEPEANNDNQLQTDDGDLINDGSKNKSGFALHHIVLGVIAVSGIVGGLVYSQLQGKNKEEKKEDKKKGNHVALASALSSEESNEDELKEWVKKALEHHPEDEIKKKLKESGWSEKLIDEVLRNK
ncbi:PGF-pre-PGF domain-containing protein [Candidatus Woesearchaeota archaeon]|jgi:PGF-pre-PGF domain-containing protein|nr:PGF-pre-PGF domain-containing protein [Candidatus Woesearchaeota archaeon]